VTPSERTFACEVLDRPAGPLRVGFLDHRPDGMSCHPEVERAVLRAVRLLESLGHEVGRSHPTALGDHRLCAMVGDVISAGIAATVGRPVDGDELEPVTWAVAERGRALSGVDLQRALAWCGDYARHLAPWWEDHDVLVMPAFPRLAPPLGADADRGLDDILRAAPFTLPANVSGQPTITLPLHWSASGLPAGVQLVGAFGREDVLLRVAAQLERAASWVDGRPPVPALAA
jgi:amidase